MTVRIRAYFFTSMSTLSVRYFSSFSKNSCAQCARVYAARCMRARMLPPVATLSAISAQMCRLVQPHAAITSATIVAT